MANFGHVLVNPVVSGDALRFLCTGAGPAGASVASPAFVVPSGAVAAEVVGVTDGDTFTARMDGMAVKIRFHGLDAPEKGQAFWDASKRALSGLIFGRSVWIQKTDRDRWGRTVAEVWTSSGKRVGLAMLESGQAWHFVKYAPADSALAAAEVIARAARRGLWVDPAPVAPWDYRKRPR